VVVEEARHTGGKRGAALEEMRAAKPQVRGAKGSPADTSSEEAVCTIGSLPRKRREVMGALGFQKWVRQQDGRKQDRLGWRR
jgi:hypothetical protein